MKKCRQILEKLKTKKWKKDQLLILVLAGILLLIVAMPVGGRGTGEKSSDSDLFPGGEGETAGEKGADGDVFGAAAGVTGSGGAGGEGQLFAYVESMERRLEKTLSLVDGVGRVKVMITLKDGGEAVVEKDRPRSSSSTTETDSAGGAREVSEETSEEETVYFGASGGGQSPYITREIEPMVEGVIVVADGGANAVMGAQITEAIQALFPVEAHKIKIMKMK